VNVLVTGGSGKIGGYVLRELLGAGHTVSSYSRTPPSVEGARFIQGDITDLAQLTTACPGHEAIVHLAAVPSPGRTTTVRLMAVNVMGTVKVLESALHSGIDKVVFASSGAATGISFAERDIIPRYLPLDEAHPSEPQDDYGLSKLLGELTCKRYSEAFGLRTICLRLGNNWYRDWEGAAVVVRSGGGTSRFHSVEELWTEYRRRQEDLDAGWPPGPRLFWDAVDARDTATAFRLALENDEIRHSVLEILGDETYALVETRELVARYYPDVPLKAPVEGYASLWSHEKAARELGYRPRHRWRESDFAAWLEGERHSV
jgi:nucleoside-diphosphate-sugar epimerase